MILRKLTRWKKPESLSECIKCVNEIRSHYKFSSRSFDNTNIENVYLILDQNIGRSFLECNYENLSISTDSKPYLMLSELHIAPLQQKKGYGISVIQQLLTKTVDIELYVADQNEAMHKLVQRFRHTVKHKPKDVSVIRIHADQSTKIEEAEQGGGSDAEPAA